MSSVIHTSDGSAIRVNLAPEAILADLSAALLREGPMRMASGITAPVGYAPFDPETGGGTVWVNAAQVSCISDAVPSQRMSIGQVPLHTGTITGDLAHEEPEVAFPVTPPLSGSAG